MTDYLKFEIVRGDNGWMSINCAQCNQQIWSGEERWWKEAKLSVSEFLSFLVRHIHR